MAIFMPSPNNWWPTGRTYAVDACTIFATDRSIGWYLRPCTTSRTPGRSAIAVACSGAALTNTALRTLLTAPNTSMPSASIAVLTGSLAAFHGAAHQADARCGPRLQSLRASGPCFPQPLADRRRVQNDRVLGRRVRGWQQLGLSRRRSCRRQRQQSHHGQAESRAPAESWRTDRRAGLNRTAIGHGR